MSFKNDHIYANEVTEQMKRNREKIEAQRWELSDREVKIKREIRKDTIEKIMHYADNYLQDDSEKRRAYIEKGEERVDRITSIAFGVCPIDEAVEYVNIGRRMSEGQEQYEDFQLQEH